MRVIQSPSPLDIQPTERSVFLAGSIDMGSSTDWQTGIAAALASSKGVLLNPRRSHWSTQRLPEESSPFFKEQVEWELAGMEAAGMIAFYFVPGSQAPITLLELGLAARSRKALVCCPSGFWRKGNVDVVCQRYGINTATTIDALVCGIRNYVEDNEP